MKNYPNLEIHTIQAFQTGLQNYIFVIKCLKTNKIIAIDPGSFEAIDEFLIKNNLNLNYILATHHHFDHTDANIKLKAKYQSEIIGFKDDESRISAINLCVKEHEILQIGELKFKIIFLPGHTLGHIAYYLEEENILFAGDVIFSSGCGRIFEGTFTQAFNSMQKIAKLPQNTEIYCAHEYTLDNIKFALSLEPNNKDLQKKLVITERLRQQNLPTILTNVANELKTNPFLRAKNVKDFTQIRKLKDQW